MLTLFLILYNVYFWIIFNYHVDENNKYFLYEKRRFRYFFIYVIFWIF